jgi:hypothetical protein
MKMSSWKPGVACFLVGQEQKSKKWWKYIIEVENI